MSSPKSTPAMNPEVSEAIKIADRHLRGASEEARKALALDIANAISRFAAVIADDLIRDACAKVRAAPPPTSADATLRCRKCGSTYRDSNDQSAYIVDGDTAGAHVPFDDCPNCGADGRLFAEIATSADAAKGGAQSFFDWIDELDRFGTIDKALALEIKRKVKALATSPAPQAPEGMVKGQFGWVIEEGDSSVAEPKYWHGSGWATDHMRAVRFSRQLDAQRVALHLPIARKAPRICEHGWN